MATETVLTCGACHGTFVIHDGEMLYSDALGTSAKCNHRVVALDSKLRDENERLRAVADRLAVIAEAVFDGHLTPETADEDHPEPYCFECELPWPCDYATLAAALEGDEAMTQRHRRFLLHRHQDISGVSGDGWVAEGVEFSNGVVALQWTSEFPTSVVFHQRGMESVEAVHGHGGATKVVWLDGPRPEKGET